MDSAELYYVIKTIKSVPIHHKERSIFHENFEWLEHYWRSKCDNSQDYYDRFIMNAGYFYWHIHQIRDLAKQFASIECVGSSTNPRHVQTGAIAQATMYLRYCCGLFDEEIPTCIQIGCRKHKIDAGLCNIDTGRKWKADFDPVFAFKALMYIIRQVRNNLFHGDKLSLEPEQFERDKKLVALSCETTAVILAQLVDYECNSTTS